MTRLEFRRLNALARKWIHEGRKEIRKSDRMYSKAGKGSSEGGTGDEGWRECLELGASGSALTSAGQELRELLAKLEGTVN